MTDDGDPKDGDDTPAEGEDTTGEDTTGEASTGEGDSDEVADCSRIPLDPGVHARIPVDFEGSPRSYNLFVPSRDDPDAPMPLVLNFHGYLSDPASQAMTTGFNDIAEARDLLVAYPAGAGDSWNGGQCCGQAEEQDLDDVGFARAVVAHVSEMVCVDAARVYATGMSNGGHLSHRLACEAADVFAAVASVTGVLGLPPARCAPARPISVLQLHGTADPIVPYRGRGPGYPPVPSMMEQWASRNGCATEPAISLRQGSTTCETWPGCDDDVEITLCAASGGGHCWPGDESCTLGEPITAIDASLLIADMFERHALD